MEALWFGKKEEDIVRVHDLYGRCDDHSKY